MEEFEVLVAERAHGKTTESILWLADAERIDTYPGWTRVLVVPTEAMAGHIRNEFRSRVPNIERRVFSFDEWATIRGVSQRVEVRIDELGMLLTKVFGIMPGRITGFTITGVPWASRSVPV